LVGLDDDASGDAEVSCEGAAGWQWGAEGESAGADVVADGGFDLAV
jgi:hypothetical protein